MSIFFRSWKACVLVLALAGCTGSNADRPRAPTEDRLVKIGEAYRRSVKALGRAPNNLEEVKPYVQGSPDDFMISPRDGEPFVIIWGVDYDALPVGPDPFTVAAYEKKGVAGKRYVLRFPPRVELMSDAELGKAVFPAGHQPPE